MLSIMSTFAPTHTSSYKPANVTSDKTTYQATHATAKRSACIEASISAYASTISEALIPTISAAY